MARPQLEDGHTKIANEIIEALAKVNLTSHESRVLWCILRKTYGWNKKTDRISYSQFQEVTGIDRRHVGRSLASLKGRQIIICQGEGYALEYGLQKDYELWGNIATIRGNEFATIPGNDLPPSEATIVSNICHHPGADLPPSQDTLPPSQATNLPPSQGTTKARKHITNTLDKSNSKQKYGEFLNVFLTTPEYEKLIARFEKEKAEGLIEEISAGIKSKGYKYKDHYAAILSWARRDEKKGGVSGTDKANLRPSSTERLKASVHPRFRT